MNMAVAKLKSDPNPVGSKVQIKDLLAHMDPMIYLAGTADNTSEMLTYLADMDPAFHKLELVKSLRREMRDELGQSIESRAIEYLEQHKGKMRAENPVDILVEQMKKEDVFKDFIDNIQVSLQESIQDISNHFDDEIVTGMFSNDDDELTYNVSPSGSNESSLNSSLNQSGLLFLHPAQYSNIARSLLNRKDYHTWNDSLNILISVTPGEPVMQDCWPDLRKGLKDCLFDDSQEIFEKSLKVHCKLLTSQVQNAVKESYLNLWEAVAGFYISKKCISKLPIKGEVVDLKSCESLIRILKVLVDFQQELPLLWIRYPERFIDDMVDTTFNILSLYLGKKDNISMTVLDMLSLVDSDIIWFKSWIHGQWGRNKTFSAMKSNSVILLYAVSYCIQYLEKCPVVIEDNGSSDILSSSLVHYLRFSQYLKLIMAIISNSDGRKLFPVNVPSKEELVTIQGIIQLLVKACYDHSLSMQVILEISSQLQKYCSRDEVKCWILCDAGIIEALFQEVCYSDDYADGKDGSTYEQDFSPMYVMLTLSILDSILSTQVGQKYILLGRKRKASSKSGLSTITSSHAYEVMNFIHFVLKNEDAHLKLRTKAIGICCALLSSPIGMHMCLEHPLIKSIVRHFQKLESHSHQNLPQREEQELCVLLHLSDSQILPLMVVLLLSYRGIYLLESEGILSMVLKRVLPQLAKDGGFSYKMFAYICVSDEGSRVIGDLGIIHPYWDIVCLAVAGEDPGKQPPKEEDKDETLMVAIAPLIALTGTYYGTKLLFTERGLLTSIYRPLFSCDKIQGELHRMALHILASATAVLDSMIFLQASINFQEHLISQQCLMTTNDGSTVMIDERSLIRNHILVKCHFLGGYGERTLPPAIIESGSSVWPQLFCAYPPPREYIPEKPIRSMHKKQNEVWRFLSDTRHGLHDIGWLNHCRKAMRSVLVSGEDIKNWLVMDIIERSVRALLTSPEELLQGSPISPGSSNNGIQPLSPDSPSPGTAPLLDFSRPAEKDQDSQNMIESQAAAMELILRYGSELQLLTGSGSFKKNLLDLLSFTQSNILMSGSERCDWFTMVIFLIFGGNSERCQNVLANISGVLVGGILWPCFSDSLSQTHELLPGEVTFSGIMHNVQLVLSIETPMLFSVMQANDSCVWNIVGEWIRCLFLGVLPWLEICHYVIIVLLQGPDYAVYFAVAFIRHLQNTILKYAGNHRCLSVLQTSTVTGWRAGEHLTFMEVLSRRHRRTVLPALISPFYNLRHEYTPKQV